MKNRNFLNFQFRRYWQSVLLFGLVWLPGVRPCDISNLLGSFAGGSLLAKLNVGVRTTGEGL